ncbi:hypothetical protein ACP70R_025212 [Stipagrostis hirtigluma subsp. patula]
MGSLGGRRRPISGLFLLVFVIVLLSAASMANGIRTEPVAAGAPSPAVATAQAASEGTAPPVPTSATASTTSSEKAHLDDPFRDSKRKVPNGPDPIHNSREPGGEKRRRGECRNGNGTERLKANVQESIH